ncbi:MAG: hypothetical protein ACTHOR_04430 [Devosia sp.]|jgi:hypothetical protein|nr:hypothetical protein [Devosiaceae bacterium]
MTDEPNRPGRARLLAELSTRTGLPQAPLAMPKQILESQPNWLFAIYTRLVRRT